MLVDEADRVERHPGGPQDAGEHAVPTAQGDETELGDALVELDEPVDQGHEHHDPADHGQVAAVDRGDEDAAEAGAGEGDPTAARRRRSWRWSCRCSWR